jgi:hypothetical protein
VAVAEFSATDVALNGFRLVWQRPRAVIYWAALSFAFSLSLNVFVTLSAGSAFVKLSGMGFQPSGDPTAMLGLVRQVLPTYLAVMAAALVLYAVLAAAMNRAVLRPSDQAFGYLRLSADELRQLGLLAALAGLGLVGYFILVMACSILAGALGMAVGAGGAMAALFAVIFVASIVALAFFGVRISLASPHTFATGRIDILGAWRMTEGRFWLLFGTYAMALALNLVVLVLSTAIAWLAMLIVSGGLEGITGAAAGDMSSLAASLKPGRLVYLAIAAVGTALSWPIRMTPPAVIYRALTGDTTSRIFA